MILRTPSLRCIEAQSASSPDSLQRDLGAIGGHHHTLWAFGDLCARDQLRGRLFVDESHRLIGQKETRRSASKGHRFDLRMRRGPLIDSPAGARAACVKNCAPECQQRSDAGSRACAAMKKPHRGRLSRCRQSSAPDALSCWAHGINHWELFVPKIHCHIGSQLLR